MNFRKHLISEFIDFKEAVEEIGGEEEAEANFTKDEEVKISDGKHKGKVGKIIDIPKEYDKDTFVVVELEDGARVSTQISDLEKFETEELEDNPAPTK